MGRTIRCCALSLMLASTASAARAEVGDCWLLDGEKLAQARQQGLCLDMFARNGKSNVLTADGPAAAAAGGERNQVATTTTLRPLTTPSRPKRNHVAEAREPIRLVPAPPSWNAPSETPAPHTMEAETVPPRVNAVPPPAAAPPDPIRDLVEGLGQDFRYFVFDLRRDFAWLGRKAAGAPEHQ